ncbi:DUF5412 family protein [Terrihalobacillus insolitus]|uniref:DUF5412 family protein n=1 Tax=Terrihalobacillus insolitus TaxID=2950438 RepID=UPI0023418123|nr:DUF5412 family protein [Terrihalobacillus insolitus]MDC3414765.1 DUF5412 domain-containing protein [Terrihalobacillus insolitus]
MSVIKKKKVWITLLIVILIGILYAITPLFRGPYYLKSVEIENLRKVGEYKSEVNNYSIKIYYKSGPILYSEYSYLGSLFKGDNFVRNVFWVGPSGNDFSVEWKDEKTIKINNLTSSNPTFTLNILKDKYDFRGIPFFN